MTKWVVTQAGHKTHSHKKIIVTLHVVAANELGATSFRETNVALSSRPRARAICATTIYILIAGGHCSFGRLGKAVPAAKPFFRQDLRLSPKESIVTDLYLPASNKTGLSMMYRIHALVLALILALGAGAQTGTVKGFVYEKSSGEPMSYIIVVLRGETTLGVQTDVNGYFSIPQVPPGDYELLTTLVGYDTARVNLSVKANEIVTQRLFTDRANRALEDVVVNARRTERTTRVNIGSTSITPREIKLLPSAGGEPDLAQYLQVVPGVVFTGDQGGQLYVRGGSPVQTGILLDGITIYNPFHSIGLYSVFETDAIRNVDVQTAGFNAQYGNRTSAILDIRTKDGNKNRLSGKLSASPIMARAMLEGPIRFGKKKAIEETRGSTTFLLSYKTSYLESSSKSLYGGFGEPFKSGLPYSFNDFYGKVTFSGENGSKLNLFGFSFDDQAKVLQLNNPSIVNATFKWRASGAGASFVVTPGTSAALINGRFAYSRYDIDATELAVRSRSSGINGFEGGIDFTYFLPGYSQLKYGVEVSGLATNVDYVNAAGFSTVLDRRNTLAALFAVFRKNFSEKFIFEPSVRVQYYATLSKISPEPRLGIKYNLSPHVRLKAATGIYSQNIISTRADIDIVNFFNGFVLSPDEEITNTKGERVETNIQTAYHAIGGVEVDVKDVEFNLEPWFKNFTRNIELNRAKRRNQDPNFLAGSGLAYGVDLSARYSKNRIFLWAVASYQMVNYKTLVAYSTKEPAAEQEYPAPFDRRVNINVVSSYTTGKKKSLEFSVRFNMGSPFPFTQTQGFFESLPFSGPLNGNYLSQNGNVGVLYDRNLNGGRLSWYHRLDLSARKRFNLSANSNIDVTLAVTNAYNRNNIFYISRLENTRVYQLPIFPSMNVTWNF